jgi:ATP-binding cassette, subfamily G (WHITE), member 2, SNQ2
MGGDQRSSSSSPNTGHGGVNVEKAENTFNELSRQLTQGTVVDDRDHGDEDSRVPTAVGKRMTRDLEKAEVDLEESFDLREYLTSSNDANERAGIKHKHVGVVWEDFHVDVLGGSDFKVGVKALQHHIGC